MTSEIQTNVSSLIEGALKSIGTFSYFAGRAVDQGVATIQYGPRSIHHLKAVRNAESQIYWTRI